MREVLTYEEYVRHISERFDIPEEELTYESSLIEDLGIDSLSLYTLLSDLEEEIQLKLDVVELLENDTIGKSYEYLENLFKEAEAK